MATIVATPSATNANSYATVAEGDAYHETIRVETASTWEDAGEDEKTRVLIQATRMLDSWYDWYGSISFLSQSLLWPRRGVIRPGAAEQTSGSVSNEWGEPFGALLPSDEIPVQIREATCELARQLLVSDRQADADLETQGISSLKAGSVALEFRSTIAKPIPDSVANMVSGLGTPRSRYGSGGVKMYRA